MKKLVTGLALATALGGTILGGMAVVQVNAQNKVIKQSNEYDITDVQNIENELENVLQGKTKVNNNWDDEMDKKYGDDWDDILDKKYGNNWENKFENELVKRNILQVDEDKDDIYNDEKYDDRYDMDDDDKYDDDKDDMDDDDNDND